MIMEDPDIDRLRAYLQEHPGTRLIDLEKHSDPETRELAGFSVWLISKKRLFERPGTKVLGFNEGPVMVKRKRTEASSRAEEGGEASEIVPEHPDAPTTAPEGFTDHIEALPSATDSESKEVPLSTAQAISVNEFCARGRDESKVAEAVPKRRFKIHNLRENDDGDIVVDAEICDERKVWNYNALEAEIGDHADQYPPMALDMLQGRKKQFPYTSAPRDPRPTFERSATDDHPMWKFTVDPDNKIPLNQLWRWPECFARIGLRCSVPAERCEEELATALERSEASAEQVKKAMEDLRKVYDKFAPGEDLLDKKTRDNIRGCGLKVYENFEVVRPRAESCGERAKEARGGELPDGELWIEDGQLGFSTVRNGAIITRTLAEWRETEPQTADLIELEYENAKGVYHMPGRPDTDREDKALIKDIIKILDKFVDLPPGEGKVYGKDSPYRTSTAAHITCTAFYDMVSVRPGLMPYAETKTGKTRLTNICSFSSYRGYAVGNPTEALIFRALGVYHVTLCIDECADTAEVLPLILTIYKLSFDGQNIGRCDQNDQRRIITYPCKGFVTLSIKSLDKVPDDSINRGVVIHLGYTTRKLEFNEAREEEFTPLFEDIRTRITALRLRALAGKIDVRAALERAGELARKKYAFSSKEYELESRDFSKARTLLLPIVLMGETEQQVRDVMEVMLRSKLEGDSAQSQSFPAKCWFSLYEEVTILYSKSKEWKLDVEGVPDLIVGRAITTKEIADTVRSYLKNEGELQKDDDLKTRKVTNALNALNFEFEEGAHRAYYLVTDKPSFQRGWRNCMQKYGLPPSTCEQGGGR